MLKRKIILLSLAFMFFYINVSIFAGNIIADYISITWLSNTLIFTFPVILGIFFLWLFDKIAYDYINFSGIARPIGAFILFGWIICFYPGNFEIIEYVNFASGKKAFDVDLNEKNLKDYSFVSFNSGYINNKYTYTDTTVHNYSMNSNYDEYYHFKFITPVVPPNWDKSMPIKVFIASQGYLYDIKYGEVDKEDYLRLGEIITDKIYLQGKVIKNKSVYDKIINKYDDFLGLKYDSNYIVYENVQDFTKYSSNLTLSFWLEILLINFVFLLFTYISVNLKNSKYAIVKSIKKIEKYLKNNNITKAESFTFYLMRKYFDIPHFYYYYALCNYHQEKYNDAINYLEKCKEKSENFSKENYKNLDVFDDFLYYNLITNSYLELEKYDKSIYYCNEALKQFKDNDNMLQQKAYILLLDKKYAESVDAYNYYFKKYPDDKPIYLSYKIEALIGLEEYSEALKEINTIIDEEEDSELYILRAKIFIGLNKTEKAKQDLQKAKELDDYDPEIDELIKKIM